MTCALGPFVFTQYRTCMVTCPWPASRVPDHLHVSLTSFTCPWPPSRVPDHVHMWPEWRHQCRPVHTWTFMIQSASTRFSPTWIKVRLINPPPLPADVTALHAAPCWSVDLLPTQRLHSVYGSLSSDESVAEVSVCGNVGVWVSLCCSVIHHLK